MRTFATRPTGPRPLPRVGFVGSSSGSTGGCSGRRSGSLFDGPRRWWPCRTAWPTISSPPFRSFPERFTSFPTSSTSPGSVDRRPSIVPWSGAGSASGQVIVCSSSWRWAASKPRVYPSYWPLSSMATRASVSWWWAGMPIGSCDSTNSQTPDGWAVAFARSAPSRTCGPTTGWPTLSCCPRGTRPSRSWRTRRPPPGSRWWPRRSTASVRSCPTV